MNFELHAALARQTEHLITERTRDTHATPRLPRATRRTRLTTRQRPATDLGS